MIFLEIIEINIRSGTEDMHMCVFKLLYDVVTRKEC